MTRFPLWVAVLAAAFAMLPSAALAGGGRNNRQAADHALKKVKDLERGIGVRTGRELTPALAQLAGRRSALDAAGRKSADALLARPTDGGADPDHEGYTVAEATPVCGVLFCFHYVTTTADAPDLTDTSPANGIPDYIEQMAAVFDEVHGCENGSAVAACAEGAGSGLGWQEPVPDGSTGGSSNKFDVYIKDLFPQGFYGYAAPECPQPLTGNSCPAYMVMDKDYDRFATSTETGTEAMEVTAAHEYNHVLQMGYDVIEDTWMFESTATYMEEKVYPSINDYLQYLPDWVNNTAQPLTEPSTQNNLKIYGSAVWNHWLDHGYGGDDVIQSAWQQSPGVGSFAPAAYGKSIQDRGGAGFSPEFETFAAAVAEWEVPGSGFPDLYPDVPSRPALPLDSASTALTLDHTTFAFRNVPAPTTATPITLTATLPSGLQGAIALVGRTGTSLTAGSVVTRIARTTSGGRLTVTLPDAQTFGRITAVFVNADPSKSGFNTTTNDWDFTKDAQTFNAVRVTTGAPAPGATTTPATAIATNSATLNGTVNPNGTATTYWFEYGTTTAYGTQVPLTPADAGSGTADGAVSALADGLTQGTTYHFRIVAQNAGGTSTGADQTFTTLAAPVVTTGVANGIGPETATLNGTVDPQGQPTTFSFEYGTTTAYGHTAPLAAGAAGSAHQPIAVTTPVTKLKPGATIHFRVVATNGSGTSRGADSTFRTRALSVAAAITKTKLRAALAKGIRARVRCNAKCSVRVELLLPAKLAKRLHMKRRVLALKVKASPAGRAARLRFAKRVARKLAGQRSVKFTLKLSATTATGGRRTVSKPLALR